MLELERTLLTCALAWCLLPAAGGDRQSAPKPPSTLPPPRASSPFEIVSCSLGCTASPLLITCTEVHIHVNEVIRVTFNQPVAPSSVNGNSFQVTDVSTGRSPPGSFAIDPLDADTLVYRPQIAFDSAGNPLFGLIPGHTYLLKLPGLSLDSLGPYITSIDGTPNQTRMQCTLVADLGTADAAPGRPSVKLEVLVVTARDPLTGEPIAFARVPAEGARDVWRSSPIDILCADLLNPATVANPVTGRSDTISVRFDPDGNIADVRDQVPIPGSFTLVLDQDRPATIVRFQALGELPPAGLGRHPGRVVVVLSPQIQDLGGNALANPGTTSFTTEAR